MYGQNTHLNGAVHLASYARDMLSRERTASQRFLEYSQVLTLLA
jgi:hypothetical protein